MIAGAPQLVLAVVTDTEWCAHINASLRRSALVRFVRHDRASDDATGDPAPDVVLLHLDARAITVDGTARVIAHLRQTYPAAALVGYCRLEPSITPHIVCAGQSGAVRVFLRGHDAIATVLSEHMMELVRRSIIRDVLARLAPIPDSAANISEHCLRRAFGPALKVDTLAQELDVTRRTLLNQLRAAGYPPPAEFISWSRLLIAARLLDEPTRTVTSIALALHFRSPAQFRGMFGRYASLTPSAARHIGALSTLSRLFREGRSATSPRSSTLTPR